MLDISEICRFLYSSEVSGCIVLSICLIHLNLAMFLRIGIVIIRGVSRAF